MKLIAIDLDGTLLNSLKMVSFESKEYLMNLRRQGYIIIIATGRTLKSALLATNGAEFAHCIICNSGALVFDNLNKRILKEYTISCETAKKVLSLYDENTKYIEMNDLEYYNKIGQDFEYDPEIARKIENVEEFLQDKNNIYQMCISFKNDKNAEKINKYILDNFEDLTSNIVRCYYGGNKHLEINKKGISKYSAISYMAKLCNISNEDIIAIGDSENDLEMIKNSGVGVAMGNAYETLKENAKYVTKTNDENGVIEFLKLYLK